MTKKYSAVESTIIVELRESGKSYREIAKSVGRTEFAIQTFFRRQREALAKEAEKVARVPRVRTRQRVEAVRASCAFTLTPALEVVEQAGGVERFVAEVVTRVPVPGWRVRVADDEDAKHHALLTARRAAAERGAEIVVFDRERVIVAERPSHAWDRTPEELRGDAFVVIPVVLDPA